MTYFTRTATTPSQLPVSAVPATDTLAQPLSSKPAEVLWLPRDTVTIIDIDERIPALMQELAQDPGKLGMDAVVHTDRGIHLYYIKPNAPRHGWQLFSDCIYDGFSAIEGKSPVFFVSKVTGKPRRMLAYTPAGELLAAEYNEHASRA